MHIMQTQYDLIVFPLEPTVCLFLFAPYGVLILKHVPVLSAKIMDHIFYFLLASASI